MNRMATIMLWDLMQGMKNRFLQVFALACIMGGTALLAASPGPETLPLILIQAILFFGSLLALLVGWSSGQQAREQGAFLFAQPIGAAELIAGKLLGAGAWCLALLLLFMGPSLIRAAMPGTLVALGGLALGFLLVCVQAGLLIGLLTSPVSGLLAAMLTWVIAVAGWELGLLMLAQTDWIAQSPGLFVGLLLANPAGAFRMGAMIGLETVPFDAAELETGRFVFQYIKTAVLVLFTVWTILLFCIASWRTARQEF